MTHIGDFKRMFDAAEFCETVKAAVGEGRISSNLALRDGTAALPAVKCLQDFANRASARVGPDVVAAYVSYSPSAAEVFTALRAISVNLELVSAALECLICIVRYSLDASRPQQPLEKTRSVVKEIVKSRAVLIYDILATDGKACAKKALTLLRLVATCHPMLVKELVNRFDLTAKSMAPSLCSITNNHCRVPFLDLMFVILASGERDVLHYLTGKGREVIVTCLRTIQERATLESNGGVGSKTKSIMWRQGKAHQSKRPKILPSHLQKRELVAAINFLLAIDKHLFIGATNSGRGAFAHPVPTLLAVLATLECPPLDVAPREVQPEHKALRSNAARIFISLVKDTRISNQDDIVRALSNPSLNFGTKSVVSFVCKVVQRRPDLAAPLLQSGRMLSTPPTLTLRWFGHFSIIAFCTVRLQKLVTSFKEKRYFERCLSSSDPLIRHLGCTIALCFYKAVGRYLTSEESADDYLPALEVLRQTAKSGTKDVNLLHRLMTSYQYLFQKQDDPGIDVKQMIASVDAAGQDAIAAARTIEGTLCTFPRSAVRKIMHKGYLSTLIVKASQSSRKREALKLWRVCGMVLLSTDLFQPGTEDEIDVYLSVLSSLGKEAGPPAKAFEAVLAQALDMPYGLYDRLHSDEWSDESAPVKTSLLSVATVIKLQKLEQSCSSNSASEGTQLVHRTLRRMTSSVVAMASVLHNQAEPKSYLTLILPSFMKAGDVYWKRTGNGTETADIRCRSRGIVGELLRDRGTYPKTKFLNLIEALAVFDHKVHTSSREFPHINAKSELGVAWDSWCDYRLFYRNDSRQWESTEESRLEKYAPKRGSFVFKGLLRLLLQATYPGRIEVKPVEDIGLLRDALSPRDYRFVACIILRTVGNARTRRKLFEEVLARTWDEEQHDKLHPEEAEFLDETMVRAIARSQTLAASEVKSVASFCFSVLSRWDSVAKWELHVAYSIAIMRTLLTHSSTEISLRFKVFLASSITERLPPIIEFTSRTAKNFLMLLEYSSCFRELAFAQVFEWTEKDFRNCNGVLLRLVSDAINSVERKNMVLECHEELIGRFLKASSKSKTEWVSIKSSEDDIRNLRALESLACIIAGSRKLCKLFLHRLVDKEMVSTNSWVLLGLVLDSSDTSLTRAEITTQEYAKLFYFILKHIGSVSESNEYPDIICVQVLGSVSRLLRLKRFSLHSDSVSSDGSLALLCRNLTTLTQSRFAMLLSNSEQVEESVSSQSLAHLQYIASALASQAEVLKLDLSLEDAARETVVSLLQNECHFLKYCLQTNLTTRSGGSSFLRVTDVVIALLLVIRASLPWLSSMKCDDELARSLLAAHALMRSRSHEIASGRSERDSTMRECLSGLSDYISAGNLQQRISTITNQSLSAGTEAATVASGLPRLMLEEAAEYILKTSYHFTGPNESSQLRTTKTLDPFFALNTFLCGCRQALLQPHAPVLDLQRVTRDGLFALSITGIASTDRDLRFLSFACLEAFTAVAGPVTGVPVGSASALYKDRRQLSFLLDLLRNSISDPLTPVLPLFAVWFRSAARIALTPNHPANKLVSTYLLRAPCMDVSDCYGLSYYLNCEARGAELKAVRALAFHIVQNGVHSERDVAVVRRRRVFDKMFMFSVSTMGFDDTIRLAALRSLEAVIHRDSLNITEELVGGRGIAAWVSSSAEHVGETMEEILTKLNILEGIAKSYIRRDYQRYASVLAEALNLFIISRLRPPLPVKVAARFTERIAKCGAQIAQMAPKKRHLFGIDFSDLWIEYGSKTILSLEAKRDFVCCICKQRNATVQPGVLEMLLEFAIHKDQQLNEGASQIEFEDFDSLMIDMFVAECILAPENRSNFADILTADLCTLLGAALHLRNSIWLLVAGVRTLDLTGHLNEKIMADTDKIPAFLPQDIEPRFERQYFSTVKDMKLIIVEALVNLCDEIINARAGDDQQGSSLKPNPTSSQT